MQGMRIKSHKGYFSNPQQPRFQSNNTWAPKFFSAPKPAVAATVSTIPVPVKTAPKARVAKARPTAKRTTRKTVRAKKK